MRRWPRTFRSDEGPGPAGKSPGPDPGCSGVQHALLDNLVLCIRGRSLPPETGTGWHKHVADFHIDIMMKGWARFMYEDKETLVSAGDCVHRRPGITHYLFDYSLDMEYLEIVGPADFGTVDVAAPCDVPPVTPGR